MKRRKYLSSGTNRTSVPLSVAGTKDSSIFPGNTSEVDQEEGISSVQSKK